MNNGTEPSPPKMFLHLFQRFCRPELRKYIEGDLLELYHERLTKSKKIADIKFILDVLLLLRPAIIRKTNYHPITTQPAMLKSYFKIGVRNLLKNGSYSVINIGGLALGLLVAALISLWVHDELTFNQSHENYRSIVQIMKGGTFEGKFYTGQRHLPYPLIGELQSTYGNNFKHIVPSSGMWDYTLTTPENVISATGIYMGSGAPEMFSFKMVHGTYDALKQKEGIILSRSAAFALFGSRDAMDEMVTVGDNVVAKVTGIFEDLPKNSTLYGVKFLGSWDKHLETNQWIKDQNWENHFLQVYAEIAPNTTLEKVGENIRMAELNVISKLDYMKQGVQFSPVIMLHPMKDWHLYSNFKEGVLDKGPGEFVWYMIFIGGFVLLLACINFMNLSTARSEKRAREVGVRKTMGSVRSQLVSQFFAESFLVVAVAYILAFVLTNLLLPLFNDFTNKELAMPWWSAQFWAASLLVIVITGGLAGSYPALYLSSFSPVRVLKGALHTSRNSSSPRKVLVVLQFSISVLLIICTVVVHNQIFYAKDRPMGYQPEGLLMMQKKSEDFDKKYDVLVADLKASGAVTNVCQSGGRVTEVWSGNGGFSWKGYPQGNTKGFSTLAVSHDFGRTVGWKFISGRDFSNEVATDSSAFVINKAAAKEMGLENPVGEVVRWTNTAYGVDKEFVIIGLIDDMVMDSPFEPVEPAVFFVNGYKSWMNLRVNPALTMAEALPKIEAVFKKVIPGVPFDFKFADEQFAQKFKIEENVGRLATVFSTLAIVISCLGLFGLASFVAEQRTKELGIRKVLGASVLQLWKLLSTEFIILVTISCVIAIPLSYYFMNDWLMQYEYRTALSWKIFAVVILVAMTITLLTVSFQALRAALANPVKSLRSE